MIYREYDVRVQALKSEPASGWCRYQQRLEAIKSEFKAALAKEYMPFYTSKSTDLVWDAAWNYGHSGGLSQVEDEYMILSLLVMRIVEQVDHI